MPKTRKPAHHAPKLLHELNRKGQHRIIILSEGAKPDHSAWFESHDTGSYKGYFASPQDGIYQKRRVPHEILHAERIRPLIEKQILDTDDSEKGD
jgi:hypothetical protein